jgi:hypothetical protein
MFMPSKGGGEMKDSSIEVSGLEAKVLSAADLEKYASQIQALKYDAQNPEMNLHAEGTYGGHKEAVKQQIRDLGKSGSRDTVVAVFEGDKIVGFMSVEKISPTEAQAKEVWTKSSGRAQRQVFRALLGKVKEHFTVKHVSHIKVDLEGATKDVRSAARDAKFQHFVKSTEESSTPKIESSSIAPDNSKHTEGVDEVVE